MPHTLRADYQSLPQAQLCLYSSLIFRNSVAIEPQLLLGLVPHLGWHMQIAPWISQHTVQVRIMLIIGGGSKFKVGGYEPLVFLRKWGGRNIKT